MARRVGASSTSWLNRFAWFSAVATLFLIFSGGMVTSKGVGLAVPDWPTTFGYNMFLFPASKWIGGIFFEHTHRLLASTVGVLTIILAIWLWRSEDRHVLRNLGLIAVAGVVLQGILGGLRVTMLKDEIGILHACLAQAFLGLIVVIALMTTNFWRSLESVVVAEPSETGQYLQHGARSKLDAGRRSWATQLIGPNRQPLGTTRVDPKKIAPIKMIAIASTIAIYAQLALGATMRHQHRDLAILDFPTANGAWIPDTSAKALEKINTWRDAHAFSDVTAFQIWLQMAHRFLALIIAIAAIAFCVRVWRDAPHVTALKRLSILWLALLVCQLTLGAWTIWSNKAADVATTHVAVGATMLSLGVSISAICWRLQSKWPGLPARENSGDTSSPQRIRSAADKMPVPRAEST